MSKARVVFAADRISNERGHPEKMSRNRRKTRQMHSALRFQIAIFLGQSAPADLATLVARNFAHKPNVARNLPLTQIRPAETQHTFAIDPLACEACHRFLTTQ